MAVAIDTKVHQWVKHIVVPIQVVSDPFDDEAVVAVNSEAEFEEAVSNAAYGCQKCLALLTVETAATECPGEIEE